MKLVPEYLISNIIARKLVTIPPEIPNNELDVGLNHEVMGSIPQITFFNAVEQIQPTVNQYSINQYVGDLPAQGSVN